MKGITHQMPWLPMKPPCSGFSFYHFRHLLECWSARHYSTLPVPRKQALSCFLIFQCGDWGVERGGALLKATKKQQWWNPDARAGKQDRGRPYKDTLGTRPFLPSDCLACFQLHPWGTKFSRDAQDVVESSSSSELSTLLLSPSGDFSHWPKSPLPPFLS